MSTVTGTQGEDRHDYTKAESRAIRQRSLRLLVSLLKPKRPLVVLTAVVIVASTALRVLGPWLISYGINEALPVAVEYSDWMPAIGVTAVYIVSGVSGAA